MEIPDYLVTQIREGKAVLFLGAGASIDARDAQGRIAPSSGDLAKSLAKRFLGSKHEDLPLHQIAEYALSESGDLGALQEHISEFFKELQPTISHRLIPSFRWWGIVTTNYDCLLEDAYQTADKPTQSLKPIVENGDPREDFLRDQKAILLLKLHGCITRIRSASCPLILTIDQYINYRQGRSRLFDTFKDWALERTVVFVGSSLNDPDLRTILLELESLGPQRPRYFAVVPSADDIQSRFWETKKVTRIQGTFAEFLQELQQLIPAAFRALPNPVETEKLPIAERFAKTDVILSASCRTFLENDVEYVKGVTATETIEPAKFYRGINPRWSAVEQGLDAKRGLTDSIIADRILIPEAEHNKRIEFILIKGHAGSGKSVLLQRLAWEAAREFNALCLFLKPHGVISGAAIRESAAYCKERIYLFVDNAADHVRELLSLASTIGTEGRQVTVFLAERINEWNVSCEVLESLLSETYELGYLSLKEIDSLICLLEKHRSLGTLQGVTVEERRAAFQERAGRQLLVALHEATLGKSFEDIIEDEFREIKPLEAQKIYLTICTLNRLDVFVRAGIIARIHGVPFSDFRERLFRPLEDVVIAEKDPIVRDYVYSARHSHVAQIVFDVILRNPEERLDVYIRCLRELNIDYSADRKAFWHMVRGRNVRELFPDRKMVEMIYEIARGRVGEEPHLLHQIAIYEMHSPDGDTGRASELLARAGQLAPHDRSIQHSRAEVLLQQADRARTRLEMEKYLKEAQQIAFSLRDLRGEQSHAYHTLVKIGLRRLKDVLTDVEGDVSQSAIEQYVKDIEVSLSEGFQQFPDDEYLLDGEAQFAALLKDDMRVVSTLERAFAANPRSSFIATRLAQVYEQHGDLGKMLETLQKALEANPADRRLHYSFGRALMTSGRGTQDELEYYLKRSFLPGDKNFEGQLLYARQLYIGNKFGESRAAFDQLRQAHIDQRLREKLRYPLVGRFRGRIVRIEATYCFVSREGSNDWLFGHRSHVPDQVWNQLALGTRVTFRIAFNMRGSNAFEIEIE